MFFVGIFALIMVGDRAMKEVENILNKDIIAEQQENMQWRSERSGKDSNTFIKYAGASVFAPLIFTIPFPTIVETKEQENQRMSHGGNYVKNILSFFAIFSIIMFFKDKNWRNHILIIAFTFGWLLILTFSGFAHSERFHLPVLPISLIFAAYGMHIVSTNKKYKKYSFAWITLMFVAFIAWNWFKLAGRGLT